MQRDTKEVSNAEADLHCQITTLHTKTAIRQWKKWIETFGINNLDSLSNSNSIRGGQAVHEIKRNLVHVQKYMPSSTIVHTRFFQMIHTDMNSLLGKLTSG